MTDVQKQNESKETLEVLELGLTFGELLYDEVAKDGFQPTDLVTVVLSERFKSKLAEAFAGVTLVPGELKSLRASGGIAMVRKLVESAERVVVKYEKEF